jgi:flagellar motor switch protein FliG
MGVANIEFASLSGVEKASVLLMTLGTATSAEALKCLTEQEIELLAPEMVRTRNVDPQLQKAIVAEFEQMCAVASASSGGGRDFTAQVLEQALGQERANQLIQQSSNTGAARPFQCLWDADAAQISRILADEQPQLVALVLANIAPDKAAAVMALLDDETQVEVAMRIASSEEMGADVISEIEEVIKANLSTTSKEVKVPVGPDALVEILGRADRSTERLVLEALNTREPEMGAEVRRRMFLFEDIVRLPDRAVQLLLREVDQDPLRLALKGADEAIQELVFRNMSERAVESLKEDIELLQNVRTKDIEAAQQQIGVAVRRLLTSGEIVLSEDEEEGQSVEQPDQA